MQGRKPCNQKLCAAPANTSYYINHYGQWLRYAFACVFECNYANELYTLVVVRPFAWCSSKDLQNGRGLWVDTVSEGGDNKGYVYLDGAELADSRFSGDFRNQIGYRYYDWISYGFYDFNDFQGGTYWGSTRPSFWVKRQKGEARHSVSSKLQVYNVDYNHFGMHENVIRENDAPNYWFPRFQGREDLHPQRRHALRRHILHQARLRAGHPARLGAGHI